MAGGEGQAVSGVAGDPVGVAVAPADDPTAAAAVEAVPEQFRCSLADLSVVVSKSTNTLRNDMRKHGRSTEGGAFPVLAAGYHGVEYVFDARAVVAFYQSLKDAADAEAEANAARLVQLRMNLVGDDSADQSTVELSPKDRRDTLAAEYHATNIARQRGDLVRADDVRAELLAWNGSIRDEIGIAADEIAGALSLDRAGRSRVEAILNNALNKAAASVRSVELSEGGHAARI